VDEALHDQRELQPFRAMHAASAREDRELRHEQMVIRDQFLRQGLVARARVLADGSRCTAPAAARGS
jgi:hypothetical protein